MAARKPLNFDLGNADPVDPPVVSRPIKESAAAAPLAEQRQQVGARIRATTYRQLKSRAALEGRKVQDLVELAVERFLKEPQ